MRCTLSVKGIRGLIGVLYAPHGASPTTEPAFLPRDITVNSKLLAILLFAEHESSRSLQKQDGQKGRSGGQRILILVF